MKNSTSTMNNYLQNINNTKHTKAALMSCASLHTVSFNFQVGNHLESRFREPVTASVKGKVRKM